jgi:hypothetical protein
LKRLDLLDERHRGRRDRDPELGAEALLQPGEGLQRRRHLAGVHESTDEIGPGRLIQRAEGGPAPRPGQSGGRIARRPGPFGHVPKRRRDIAVQFRASLDDPVVVQFLQQVPAAERERRLELALRDQPPNLPQIHVQVIARERHGVAPGGQVAAEIRAEHRAKRPDSAAQAGPRAGVQDVGPEQAREPGPRMPARVDRQPAQERACPSAGRQLRRLAGEPDLQFTDHADLKHGCRHSRLARRAENSPVPSLTCALTAR